MNCLKIEWSRNVLFAASPDYAENVMPHYGFTGICDCTGVKGIKMRCCLLFSG